MLAYVSITPLGRPVEPEVNMTVATSSGRIAVMPSRRSSTAAGSSQAAAAASSLSDQRHALLQFLDIDQLGIELQREAIEHPPAGQHMADAALGELALITSEVTV